MTKKCPSNKCPAEQTMFVFFFASGQKSRKIKFNNKQATYSTKRDKM